MADQVAPLTDEELRDMVMAGDFQHDPSLINKLNSDERRRFVKVNAEAHPTEGRIGAAPETNVVTFGDFRTDPMAALRKSLGIVGSDLTNPKVMLPLLASGVAGAVAGAADRAPSMPSFSLKPETMQDLGILAGPRVGAVARLGRRAMENLRGTTPEPSPAPQAPPESPLALTHRVRDEYRAKQAEAAPASAATPPAVAPTAAPTPDVPTAAPSVPKATKGRGAKAVARQASTSGVTLTPAEEAQAVRWLSQGVDPDVVVQRIMQSRELTQTLNLHTPDEAASIVDQRNVTGDWPPQFTKPTVKK